METISQKDFSEIILDTNVANMAQEVLQPYIYNGLKIFLIIALVIYAIVALFTIKQINLMTHTIKSDTNRYIYLIGYIHLFAVLFCLAFAIIVL